MHDKMSHCRGHGLGLDTILGLSKVFSHLSVDDQHEAIFRNITQSLSRVSSTHDVFTDDDHKPLDAQILKTFNVHRVQSGT